MMKLFRYDIDFRFVKGINLVIAGALSRAYIETLDIETERPRILNVMFDNFPEARLQEVKKATLEDADMQLLMELIAEGWPEARDKVPYSALPYFDMRDVLSVQNGIIVKGKAIVIPKSLRKDMKNRLHSAHLGYDSMMRRARGKIFWLGMAGEIKQMVETCEACEECKPRNQREPLLQHSDGDRPWNKQTEKYMKQNSAKHFPGQRNGFAIKEYARHIKGWNFVFVIGDICTLFGTIRVAFTMDVKLRLHRFDEYAIWLGLGCLLCWICLASYVHFSDKFNLLFKTMYHAIPHVLAYLICVCLLFVGFTVCGYVVFGPYHIKFQTMSKTADTLFAMITGDEIYVTLAVLETDKLGSQAVWWFAQTYLWLFVSIFTVLILNILIAIFNSAYEVIQKEYEKRRAKENSDPLRRVLHELLHSDDNLQGSIRQVQNGLLEILNRQDNSDMSLREHMLRQELKAVAINNYTFRKSKIKAFMESGGERPEKHLSCWKVHCIIPKEDSEVI